MGWMEIEQHSGIGEVTILWPFSELPPSVFILAFISLHQTTNAFMSPYLTSLQACPLQGRHIFQRNSLIPLNLQLVISPTP